MKEGDHVRVIRRGSDHGKYAGQIDCIIDDMRHGATVWVAVPGADFFEQYGSDDLQVMSVLEVIAEATR